MPLLCDGKNHCKYAPNAAKPVCGTYLEKRLDNHNVLLLQIMLVCGDLRQRAIAIHFSQRDQENKVKRKFYNTKAK